MLFITYWLCLEERALDEEETHILYTIVFMGLGMLFTIVYPATSITSEKEARSWPLLLATTIDDGQILFGKFIGILFRCLPIWFLLLGHVFLFTLVGYIHPVAIVQICILVDWIVVFLSGTGLYFSSCFKHTTTAVIMNFVLAVTIWAVVPMLLGLMGIIMREGDFVEAYMDTNPFVHAAVIMDATANSGSALSRYNWIGFGNQDVVESTSWILACMAGYISIGAFFAWRAKCRFRRNIF
jgi:ABC-type transport system involved in multi-copper enzyme maturation permease subunit